MKKRFQILMDKAVEGGAGGGGTPNSKTQTPPATPQTPPASQAAGAESETDDFGYATPAESAPAPNKEADPGKKPEQEKQVPEQKNKEAEPKVEKPVSGYGAAEPIKEMDPEKPAAPEPEKPASTQEKLGYELDHKKLGKADADAISDFAKKHNLPKEAAQAMIDQKQSEIDNFNKQVAEAQKENQRLVQKRKADWDKELRDDPTFGRENYANSVNRAEQVLEKFFPETKKLLTDNKGMLPPSVMRDLAKAHEVLFPRENFVQGGEPQGGGEEAENPNSHLDFYE